jgi:hypothetical protein
MADQIAAMSAQILKLPKHAMLHGAGMPLEQAMAYERAMLAVVQCLTILMRRKAVKRFWASAPHDPLTVET